MRKPWKILVPRKPQCSRGLDLTKFRSVQLLKNPLIMESLWVLGSEQPQSNRRVLPSGPWLKVCGALDALLPPFGFTLGLGQLNHKKWQDDHSSKEGENWYGLADFLIITSRHYSSRDVPRTTLPRRKGPNLGPVSPHIGQSHFVQIHWEKLLVLP